MTNTQPEKPTWDAEPNPMFDGFAKGEPYGHFEIDTLRFNEFQRGWLECEAVNQHYGLKAENKKLKIFWYGWLIKKLIMEQTN